MIDEQLELQIGDARDYPFELTVPEDSPPTVMGSATTPPCASNIEWAMTAVAHLLQAPGEYAKNPATGYKVNMYNAGMAPLDRGD